MKNAMPAATPPPAPAKHVVIVGTAYPYRGGIAQFIEAMAKGLHGRQYEVVTVTFTRQYPELFFPGKTQYETDRRPGQVGAIRMIDTVNPLTWYKTARYLAKLSPVGVIFHYWMPFFAPAYGVIARRLQREGIRTVAMVHNALPHERRIGDKALARYFFKACDGFLVMSQAVRQDVERLGAVVPIKQVGHPVWDTFGEPMPRAAARAELGLPEDGPLLLFFGFIRKYKGLHVLLKAMGQVKAQLPTAQLVVAGEWYEDDDTYNDLIAVHQLQDQVRFDDTYIPITKVCAYFCAADLVVQPYVAATQSGVAQLAFHFERPLVVTDVGGLPEVVKDGVAGLVVPPEDPDALAAAIVRFFKEGMAERLEAGVREARQHHSWGHLLDALETLL